MTDHALHGAQRHRAARALYAVLAQEGKAADLPVLPGEQTEARPALLALDTLEFALSPDLPFEQAVAMARSAVEALGLKGSTTTFHSYHNETALYVTAHVAAASGVLHSLNAMRLRVLRLRIERELQDDGLGWTLDDAQAAIFADVCRVLGMDEGEMLFVMGESYSRLVHGPDGGKS